MSKANLVARFGTRFNQSFSFEILIGLKSGTHAEAIVIAQHANRRQLVANLQDLIMDHLFQAAGDLQVQVIGAVQFVFVHLWMESDLVKVTEIKSDAESLPLHCYTSFRLWFGCRLVVVWLG